MKSRWVLAFGLWACVAWSASAQEAEPEPTPETEQAEPAPDPAPAEAESAPSPGTPETARILVEGGDAVESGDLERVQAEGEASELSSRVIRLKDPPRDRLRQSGDAGALRGLRVLGVQDGAARVALANGTERTLRAGDVIAGDVVRSVSGHRILLERQAGEDEPGVSASVIVKIGAGGATRVYVLWRGDPRPAMVPEVRR